MRYGRILYAGVLCTFCCMGSLANAQTNCSPIWLWDLTDQLTVEKECDVEFYIRTKDFGSDGGGYVEARAKCKDGREFDAYREAPVDGFTIIECTHAVCEAKPEGDGLDPAKLEQAVPG